MSVWIAANVIGLDLRKYYKLGYVYLRQRLDFSRHSHSHHEDPYNFHPAWGGNRKCKYNSVFQYYSLKILSKNSFLTIRIKWHKENYVFLYILPKH